MSLPLSLNCVGAACQLLGPRSGRWATRVSVRAPAAVDALAGIAGLGFGVTVALAFSTETWGSLRAPGEALTAAGRVTGLAGSYLMLIVVLLVARVPFLERTIGQGRLIRWHRLLGPSSLVLIAAHGALVAAGYAQAARVGVVHQLGELIVAYPGVLAATVGFALLVLAGLVSARFAKRRLRYETWWAIHLYTYLGLALSLSHQLVIGASFIGGPVARSWWIAVWLTTAGTALAYRVLLPLWRTLFHRLRVVAVQPEGPGVVSLFLKGEHLERIPAAGGQFFQLRFLKRGMWWQAHPYSLSALPQPPYMRFTVKAAGDHTGSLGRIERGTRVAIEGPYGAFTADTRRRDRVALIGAGIGITPLRTLLEDLPVQVDVVMLARVRRKEQLVLRGELEWLLERHGDRLHELLGPRERLPAMKHALGSLIPDIAERDVYVCGPPTFTVSVRDSALALGVPAGHIHYEPFAF